MVIFLLLLLSLVFAWLGYKQYILMKMNTELLNSQEFNSTTAEEVKKNKLWMWIYFGLSSLGLIWLFWCLVKHRKKRY